MWASKQLSEANPDSVFAFPGDCNKDSCKANSASGALNKWLHHYVPENYVNRHIIFHSQKPTGYGISVGFLSIICTG